MASYLIRTKAGDKGPFDVARLQDLVEAGKLPRTARVIDAETGDKRVVGDLLDAAADDAADDDDDAGDDASERGRERAKASHGARSKAPSPSRASPPPRPRAVARTRARPQAAKRADSDDSAADDAGSDDAGRPARRARRGLLHNDWVRYGGLLLLALVGASVYFARKEAALDDRRAGLLAAAHRRFDGAVDDPAYGRFLIDRLHEGALARAKSEAKVRVGRSRSTQVSYDEAVYMAEMERLVALHAELGERSPHWLAYAEASAQPSGAPPPDRRLGAMGEHVDAQPAAGAATPEAQARRARQERADAAAERPPAEHLAALEALVAEDPADPYLERRLGEARERVWAARVEAARAIADLDERIAALSALLPEAAGRWPDPAAIEAALADARVERFARGRAWRKLDAPITTSAVIAPAPGGGVVAFDLEPRPWEGDGPPLVVRTWDGRAWATRFTAPEVPEGLRGRVGTALALDPRSGRVWASFGAVRRNNLTLVERPLLSWDGERAERITVAGGPQYGLSDHAAAFDAARGEVVLFGGRMHETLDQTWVWSGDPKHAWEAREARPGPPARSGHAMAYDERRQVLVLFGGRGASGEVLADTWEWNGEAWAARTVEPAPPARDEHVLVFDALSGRTLCLGGGVPAEGGRATVRDDAWTWDGERWEPVEMRAGPRHLYGASAAYDRKREALVVAGGRDGAGKPVAWELVRP